MTIERRVKTGAPGHQQLGRAAPQRRPQIERAIIDVSTLLRPSVAEMPSTLDRHVVEFSDPDEIY
jgi:hypothetical protein